MAEDKTCNNCEHIGFDTCMLGYCGNPMCIYYRHIILDDSGFKVKNCDDFEQSKKDAVAER